LGSFAGVTDKLESVPVGKADAPVRDALADVTRIGCAVDAVAFADSAIQTRPTGLLGAGGRSSGWAACKPLKLREGS